MNSKLGDDTHQRISQALRTTGGHLSIDRGGYSLYFDRGSTLSGYDCETMKAACIARGLPVIDSRNVPFDDVFSLAVKGPMIAVGIPPDEPPWHALTSAPLQAVGEAYRAAGAEVFNLPACAACDTKESLTGARSDNNHTLGVTYRTRSAKS